MSASSLRAGSDRPLPKRAAFVIAGATSRAERAWLRDQLAHDTDHNHNAAYQDHAPLA